MRPRRSFTPLWVLVPLWPLVAAFLTGVVASHTGCDIASQNRVGVLVIALWLAGVGSIVWIRLDEAGAARRSGHPGGRIRAIGGTVLIVIVELVLLIGTTTIAALIGAAQAGCLD